MIETRNSMQVSPWMAEIQLLDPLPPGWASGGGWNQKLKVDLKPSSTIQAVEIFIAHSSAHPLLAIFFFPKWVTLALNYFLKTGVILYFMALQQSSCSSLCAYVLTTAFKQSLVDSKVSGEGKECRQKHANSPAVSFPDLWPVPLSFRLLTHETQVIMSSTYRGKL